jgi:RNA polymerase sigma-70 factor (ECF subfamily)
MAEYPLQPGSATMANPDHFAALATQHTRAVLRVAAALVGQADAEDAAQEALTRAWQAWESLREEAALRSWLLKITVNVCNQWLRGGFGRRERLTAPLLEDSDVVYALLDTDLGTSDHTGSLDLRNAINALDADLRLIVTLRYYGGMDASEIGATLGAPSATVRTRLRRALTLLRAHLGVTEEPSGGKRDQYVS